MTSISPCGEARRQRAAGFPREFCRLRSGIEVHRREQRPGQARCQPQTLKQVRHRSLAVGRDVGLQTLLNASDAARVREEGHANDVPGKHVARQVQHRRPGKAAVGEEHISFSLGNRPARADEDDRRPREGDASTRDERGKRLALDDERNERRPGRNNGVAERRRQPVAVAGGSQGGVRPTAGGEDEGPPAGDYLRASGAQNREPLRLHRRVANRDACPDLHPATASLPEEQIEHILCLSGRGEDAAVGVLGERDPSPGAVGGEVAVGERIQGRAQEPASLAWPGPASVVRKEVRDLALVGEVALSSTGGEELAAGVGHVFEHHGPRSCFGGSDGREQAGRASADDDHVPRHRVEYKAALWLRIEPGWGTTDPMDRAAIAKLPKFDLHCHLDGSLRPETVRELWNALPARERPRIAAEPEVAVIPRVPCSLEAYLKAFAITVALLQTEDALERAAWELCEDAAREGVVYIEIRFAPLLHLGRGLIPDEVVEAVLAGTRRAERELPIHVGVILCGMREEPPERSAEVALLAGRYRDRGVVGFDLAGPEKGFPLADHSVALRLAREAGVHLTLHAGEGCCPEHIGEALDLGAERIGHGVYLFQDPAAEERVREARIPLEVCPTSNLQISGIMRTLSDHPLRRYLDQGIRVTVNTDNRLMSQTSSTDELWRVVQAFGLTAQAVRTILLTSAEAAFAPEPVRQELVAKARAAL